MALTHTPPVEMGKKCPTFALPSTCGSIITSEMSIGPNGLLVMFICNHCPYVQAIENRLISTTHLLRELGFGVVAISSNDASAYPDDSFEKMKERANLKSYPFPYLFDENQQTASAFGAVCTPDFFLFDKEFLLSYRGRLDDSWKDEALVNKQELVTAAKKISMGLPLDEEQIPSMGCSIKWRKK